MGWKSGPDGCFRFEKQDRFCKVEKSEPFSTLTYKTELVLQFSLDTFDMKCLNSQCPIFPNACDLSYFRGAYI
jgi:hypothetical protein